MLSFIVPAYNEEKFIAPCLTAIHTVMALLGDPYEIVVADDASTDATVSIATQLRARVIHVQHRQIAATRNAGARASQGDPLVFVDADTLVNERTIRSALQIIRDGALGGGCVPRFDGRLPFWWRITYPVTAFAIRFFRQPGGSCLFCTRAVFNATGGFSEAHFAAEDALFVATLKRHGRFVMAESFVETSGRNLRAHSLWTIARLLTRLAIDGPDAFRSRQGLEFWYDPHRTKPR